MDLPGQKILKTTLGVCNTYLIRGRDGWLLVDAGNSHKGQLFFGFLEKHGILAEDIKLIVITHAHYDHVGSLAAIRERCRCPVMVHAQEASILEQGTIAIPAGTFAYTRLVSWLGRNGAALPGYRALLGFDAVKPELVVNGDMPLEQYGFDAMVRHTPGHTSGSLTVLLGSGEAFCGDLAMNYYPFNLGPIFPVFANDVPQVYKSWEELLACGAKTIYPAHGVPFSSELLKQRIQSKYVRVEKGH